MFYFIVFIAFVYFAFLAYLYFSQDKLIFKNRYAKPYIPKVAQKIQKPAA